MRNTGGLLRTLRTLRARATLALPAPGAPEAPRTLGALVLAALLLAAAPAMAGSGPPDLTGVWSIVGHTSTLKTIEGSLPPLNAAARTLYEQHLAAAARGDRSFDGVTRCLPPGLPRLMLMNEPFEILQRQRVIYFVHQLNRLPRRAYLGEQLPEDPDPLYLGFSVAHWQGDVLVIESSGFREGTLLDDAGLPHSDALHLTERYQLGKDGRTLHARFTIEDPKTYTHSWNAQAEYVRRPGYEIPEEVCADQLASKLRQNGKD